MPVRASDGAKDEGFIEPQRNGVLAANGQTQAGLTGPTSVIDQCLKKPPTDAATAPIWVNRDGELRYLRRHETVPGLVGGEAPIPGGSDALTGRLGDDRLVAEAPPFDDVPGGDRLLQELLDRKKVPWRTGRMDKHLVQERLVIGTRGADYHLLLPRVVGSRVSTHLDASMAGSRSTEASRTGASG